MIKILISLALVAPVHAFAQAKTWRLAVISDMNGSYGSKTYSASLDAAIAHIKAQGADAVLSTGDIVAGQKTGLDYSGMWRAFHSHVSTPLGDSQIPLLPSAGNHDAATGSKFQRERDEYKKTWNALPITRFNGARAADTQVQFLPGVAQNYPLNYAVTMGPAIFIALDATAPGTLINSQLAWLEDVLSRSSAFTVKIVFGHMPLYPYAFQRAHEHLAQGTVASGFYRRFEEVLENNQVDLFLSGHHHVFYPGKRNGSVRYVSVPLLGSGSRYLLNAEGTQGSRAPQGFLYLDFNAAGEIEMRALRSPSMTEIALSEMPASITIPRKSSSDCSGCGSFPSQFFLNSSQRSVYYRW
jgi:acid phosphatase type 7